MNTIDEVLGTNKDYAGAFAFGDLPIAPARKLIVVACMDARLDVERVLGLKTGDAHIIRNAGGIVTEDVLRSLLISLYIAGTRQVMLIHHTDCGMLKIEDEGFRSMLREKTGKEAEVPARFHAFADLDQSVRDQIRTIRSHPWIPADIPVRGFIYDVRTGVLREVGG